MNYLPHEMIVKYDDGLFAQSQEWQWFIDAVQKNYVIKDIRSWNEFKQNGIHVIVLKYFSKILEVCYKEWKFCKPEFEELWNIAKYYHGDLDENDCISRIQSNPNRIFFLCTWITKIENGDNGTSYYFDDRLLCMKNYFELISCDALRKHEVKILGYAQTIHIDDMDKPVECLHQNLHHCEVPADERFLTEHENYFMNYNTFPLHEFNVECVTWQELCLLNVTRKPLSREKVQPEAHKDTLEPDPLFWTEENLKKVKEYFDHEISDFVVDTVLYIDYGVDPSKKVKILHCKLLLEALNDPTIENEKIIFSSSFDVLSRLFKDNLMKECLNDNDYVQFLKTLEGWKIPSDVLALKNGGYPVTKEQNNILTEFINNKYKEIDYVSSFDELYAYLNDEMTPHAITREFLRKVYEKFETCVVKSINRNTPGAFYSLMNFLIRAKSESKNLDKHYVEELMLRVQKTWQKSVYETQLKAMQQFSQKIAIEEDQVDSYSMQWLNDPVIFAHSCIPCTEKEILNIMETVSEHPFYYECSHITLDSVFPVKDDTFSLEKQDTKLLNFVNNIKQNRGYRLLNQMESETYVWAVHSAIKSNTQFAMSVFSKEQELYEAVKNHALFELLPFSDEISAAYVAQLFPLLELKIQELVKPFKIFPFKENTGDTLFMQHKDPSSLLRELLEWVYDKRQSLGDVPDLLFIYNIMFNRNSCNVRNSFIHGKDYLDSSGMRFAFRTTLFAIHMVDFRLEEIKENTCNLMD